MQSKMNIWEYIKIKEIGQLVLKVADIKDNADDVKQSQW